jgi:rRNA maturation endonuclease Nob1
VTPLVWLVLGWGALSIGVAWAVARGVRIADEAAGLLLCVACGSHMRQDGPDRWVCPACGSASEPTRG